MDSKKISDNETEAKTAKTAKTFVPIEMFSSTKRRLERLKREETQKYKNDVQKEKILLIKVRNSPGFKNDNDKFKEYALRLYEEQKREYEKEKKKLEDDVRRLQDSLNVILEKNKGFVDTRNVSYLRLNNLFLKLKLNKIRSFVLDKKIERAKERIDMLNGVKTGTGTVPTKQIQQDQQDGAQPQIKVLTNGFGFGKTKRTRTPSLWIKVSTYVRRRCDFSDHGRRLAVPIIKRDTVRTRKLPKNVQRDGKRLYKLSIKLYTILKREGFQNKSDGVLRRRMDQLYDRFA